MHNLTNQQPTNLKIIWLSILQGWGMLLVIIGHAFLTVFQDPSIPLIASIERIIYSFHMPLFMFISGYLFFLTKLSNDKKYNDIIKDKAKRLLIPFLFFTLGTYLLKYIFNPLMNRHVEFSVREIVNILTLTSNPLLEMWFITTLFLLLFISFTYRWSLNNIISIIIIIFIGLILNIFFPRNIHLFCISNVAIYFIYFYLGILFSKYQKLCLIFNNVYVLLISLILFIIFNVIIKNALVIQPFIGILFSLSLCLNISKYFPKLFQSFRNYTFQIFLGGIFFQVGVKLLYAKIKIPNLYLLMWLLNILLGIYMPTIIAYIIDKKINNTIVRLCFGLKENNKTAYNI